MVVFPFRPFTDFEEVYSFNTVIRKTLVSERRQSLRPFPLIKLSYKYYLDDKDTIYLRNYLSGEKISQLFSVPMWYDALYYNKWMAGRTGFAIDTDGIVIQGFYTGPAPEKILIYENKDKYEVKTLYTYSYTLSGGRIVAEFDTPLTENYENFFVCPLRKMYLEDGINIERMGVTNVINTTFVSEKTPDRSFYMYKNENNIVIGQLETDIYKQLPVFPFRNSLHTDISDTITREEEWFSSGQDLIDKDSFYEKNSDTYGVNVFLDSLWSSKRFVMFISKVVGRYGAFFLPNYDTSLKILSIVGDEITIQKIGLFDNATDILYIYIEKTDGTFVYKEIDEILESNIDPENRERIKLTQNVDVQFASVKSIGFLDEVRFMNDSFTLESNGIHYSNSSIVKRISQNEDY